MKSDSSRFWILNLLHRDYSFGRASVYLIALIEERIPP